VKQCKSFSSFFAEFGGCSGALSTIHIFDGFRDPGGAGRGSPDPSVKIACVRAARAFVDNNRTALWQGVANSGQFLHDHGGLLEVDGSKLANGENMVLVDVRPAYSRHPLLFAAEHVGQPRFTAGHPFADHLFLR
jgi:hypothetical protein